MRIAVVHCIVLALGLAPAGAAHAEQAPPALRAARDGVRAYISINAGAQLTRSDFTGDLTFPLYGESAGVDTRYDVPAGPLVDIGAGVRVAGGLAVGASVMRYQQRGSATIDARLPHPLLPETQRALTETAVDLDRAETAIHTYVAWLVPAGDRVTVAILGGPSFFRLEQDTVSGLDLDEAYPFDEVSLRGIRTVREEESTTGFSVGTDVIYRLTRSVGVGGIARYSRGALDAGGDGRAGGLQLSGGLRVVF